MGLLWPAHVASSDPLGQFPRDPVAGVTCRYRESSYDHSAIIIGPTPFTAVDQIATPDLRAGLAYVIAAAVARGTTMVTGIDLLERGYGNIVPRLAAMNLDIERIPIDS